MSELKSCPFCGSENIAVGSDKGTVYRRNTAFGDLTRSVPTVRWAYCVDCGCVAPAEKVNNFDGFYKPDEQEDALNRAISTWNRRAQPANDPLTLEQMVEKRGEPLWYRPIGEGTPFDYDPAWFICNLDNLPEPFYSYGKTWLAYDHKPGGNTEK